MSYIVRRVKLNTDAIVLLQKAKRKIIYRSDHNRSSSVELLAAHGFALPDCLLGMRDGQIYTVFQNRRVSMTTID